jgi:hypothetical protein
LLVWAPHTWLEFDCYSPQSLDYAPSRVVLGCRPIQVTSSESASSAPSLWGPWGRRNAPRISYCSSSRTPQMPDVMSEKVRRSSFNRRLWVDAGRSSRNVGTRRACTQTGHLTFQAGLFSSFIPSLRFLIRSDRGCLLPAKLHKLKKKGTIYYTG